MAAPGSRPSYPATLRRTAPSFILDTLGLADATGTRSEICLGVRAIAHLHGLLVDGQVPPDVHTELRLTIFAALDHADRVRGWSVERVGDAHVLKIRCTRIPMNAATAIATTSA